jgi:uncharacterized protein with ParB-like and HNH nuclease domain
MGEQTQVISTVATPKYFVDKNILFSIPSYQRPYVWPYEAIKSLFDDLLSAWKNNLPHYYVGTILTAVDNEGVYELIDGQQRTTSLMLLALACQKKGIKTQLTKLIVVDKKLRLRFKIRQQVEAYLNHMANPKAHDNLYPGDSEIENDDYLKCVAKGLTDFENMLDNIEDTKDKNNEVLRQQQRSFADYIYENMRMVNNQIPRSTDLNRLFATMNNSGIQLEQTDILKSLLLKQVSTDKARYNAIWQACENINNYFERNVQQTFAQTQRQNLTPDSFAFFDETLFLTKAETEQDSDNGLTIAQIMVANPKQIPNPGNNDSNNNNADDNDNQDEIFCSSIISFAQLLLHAYRIYRHQIKLNDFEPRFHSDQLISVFETLINNKDGKESVEGFLKCLWQVRFAFDSSVVKWVEKTSGEEPQLLLCNISQSNHYISRTPKDHSNLSMLQMIRHFTSDRNAQYWLTPFLGWLICQPVGKEQENDVIQETLEDIDNQLSLTALTTKTMKAASFLLLADELNHEQSKPTTDLVEDYFNDKDKGVHFGHYWFQKLEYLLYKDKAQYFKEKDDGKMSKYRIISRNSVEHVHPQNDEYGKKLQPGHLNCFGNLALLNVSQNSSYSNQSVGKKREDFKAKPQYDSLKLKHMFDLMGDADWNETKIKQHQTTMIELLIQHYNKSQNN